MPVAGRHDGWAQGADDNRSLWREKAPAAGGNIKAETGAVNFLDELRFCDHELINWRNAGLDPDRPLGRVRTPPSPTFSIKKK